MSLLNSYLNSVYADDQLTLDDAYNIGFEDALEKIASEEKKRTSLGEKMEKGMKVGMGMGALSGVLSGLAKTKGKGAIHRLDGVLNSTAKHTLGGAAIGGGVGAYRHAKEALKDKLYSMYNTPATEKKASYEYATLEKIAQTGEELKAQEAMFSNRRLPEEARMKAYQSHQEGTRGQSKRDVLGASGKSALRGAAVGGGLGLLAAGTLPVRGLALPTRMADRVRFAKGVVPLVAAGGALSGALEGARSAKHHNRRIDRAHISKHLDDEGQRKAMYHEARLVNARKAAQEFENNMERARLFGSAIDAYRQSR